MTTQGSAASAAAPLALQGRVIRSGQAAGVALVSPAPIGFLGGVEPETGVIVEPNHPLRGACIAGRVLVFPTGKGSTVGSYTILRLAAAGKAPAAIINRESEAIVAVGAIIADIPMMDQVDVSLIQTGDYVRVDGPTLLIERGAPPDAAVPARASEQTAGRDA